MENVEAMLCAYIEGDLDQAGRAEIERHLRDHPQHRKLIDDLVSMRGLLQDLPRVSAPAEVSAAVSQGMERSMLLDDRGPYYLPARINWRQYVAIAAVFLITTGVGLVVYQMVLPSGNHIFTLRPWDYDDVGTGPLVMAPTVPDTTLPSGGVASSNSAALNEQIRNYVHSVGSGSTKPFVLQVSGDNAGFIGDKIVSFFNSNNITYSVIKDETGLGVPPVRSMPSTVPTTDPVRKPETQLPATRSATENLPARYAVHGMTIKQIGALTNTLDLAGTQQQISVPDAPIAPAPDTRPAGENKVNSEKPTPLNDVEPTKSQVSPRELPPTIAEQNGNNAVQGALADQPVDVVIVVQQGQWAGQSGPNVRPTTRPTTQPDAP